MRREEEQLQRAVCGLLAIYEAKHLLAFCHVPNGGYRTPAQAGAFRAMGVRSGVPDLIVWTPEGHSFGVELKAGRGKESDAQVLFRSTLESLGHRVYVCWSIEEVEAALRLERVPAVGKLAGKAVDGPNAPEAVGQRETAGGHSAAEFRAYEAIE